MSPEYLSPGVYVEEVDKGTKPIEGAGTAMAAFVGFAEQGPVNQPTFIPNWTEFVNTFGGFLKGVFLAPAVYGYFQNGGSVFFGYGDKNSPFGGQGLLCTFLGLIVGQAKRIGQP